MLHKNLWDSAGHRFTVFGFLSTLYAYAHALIHHWHVTKNALPSLTDLQIW